MNYIDENEFKEVIKEYQQNPSNRSNANKLAKMFSDLVKGVIKGTSVKYFSKHTSLQFEDLVQEGVLKCFMEVNKYNPRRGNAFGFFSTIVKYALIIYINKNYFYSDLTPSITEAYFQLIKSSTEEEILNLLQEWNTLLKGTLKKIMPQYKYQKYLRAHRFIENILKRGYYTKKDLLHIKNKIIPSIIEIEGTFYEDRSDNK